MMQQHPVSCYPAAVPHQGKYTSALAGQSRVVIKIIHQDILTALADATNDLSMPCHELRTGAATVAIAI